MFEPLDNVPTEWYRPARGRLLRERLSEIHWKKLMVSFAKFVMLCTVNLGNEPMEPEEMLEAWLELTYNKTPSPALPILGEQGREKSAIPVGNPD